MPEDVSYPHSPDCTHSASPFYLFFLITRLFLSYFISAFLSRFVSLRLTRLFSPAAVFFHPHANFLLFFFSNLPLVLTLHISFHFAIHICFVFFPFALPILARVQAGHSVLPGPPLSPLSPAESSGRGSTGDGKNMTRRRCTDDKTLHWGVL